MSTGNPDWGAAIARAQVRPPALVTPALQNAEDQRRETIAKMAGHEARKDYTDDQRKASAAKGHALDDGSYPIEDADDLHNAATLAASGHGDVSAAKALIRRRAKELGVDVTTLPGFGDHKES